MNPAPSSSGDNTHKIFRVLAKEVGMDFEEVIPSPDPTIYPLLTRNQVEHYHALVVARTALGLRVHISDPLDFDAMDAVRYILKENLNFVVTPKETITAAIEKLYASGSDPVS